MSKLDDHIMVYISTKEKEALGKYAAEHKQSLALVVRLAIAAHIEYDMSSEPDAARAGTKYANADERRKAYLERAKADRANKREVREAYARGDKRAAMLALARTLGISSLEDLDAVLAADDDDTSTEEEE